MPSCPYCASSNSASRGSKRRPNRYQCTQCHKYFVDRGSPKVLVFDIETLPLIVRAWGTGKQYISHESIIHDYVILSWSAKWLMSPDTMADILTPTEAIQRDDKRIVQKMWNLLDKADVVIYQNGDRFDRPKLNSRFLYHGFPPPSPSASIDTLKASQAAFGMSSNRLDYLTYYVGLPRKVHTDYQLWIDCEAGKKQALRDMLSYNKNDIWILEDYYLKIRAWIPNHPNFSAYTHKYVDIDAGEHSCPICRHVINEASLTKHYRTPLGYTYRSFRCSHCGANGRKNERIPHQSIPVRSAGIVVRSA